MHFYIYLANVYKQGFTKKYTNLNKISLQEANKYFSYTRFYYKADPIYKNKNCYFHEDLFNKITLFTANWQWQQTFPVKT